MRIANLDGRLVVVTAEAGDETAHDVEKNSSGQFGLVSRIEGIGELRHRFVAAT
jgi:hypothetical protein